MPLSNRGFPSGVTICFPLVVMNWELAVAQKPNAKKTKQKILPQTFEQIGVMVRSVRFSSTSRIYCELLALGPQASSPASYIKSDVGATRAPHKPRSSIPYFVIGGRVICHFTFPASGSFFTA